MEKNEQYNIGKLHSKKQVLKSGDVIKMDDIHEENHRLLVINAVDISNGYLRSIDRAANKNYTVAECIDRNNQFVRVTIGNIKYDGVFFLKHVDLGKYTDEIFNMNNTIVDPSHICNNPIIRSRSKDEYELYMIELMEQLMAMYQTDVKLLNSSNDIGVIRVIEYINNFKSMTLPIKWLSRMKPKLVNIIFDIDNMMLYVPLFYTRVSTSEVILSGSYSEYASTHLHYIICDLVDAFEAAYSFLDTYKDWVYDPRGEDANTVYTELNNAINKLAGHLRSFIYKKGATDAI